MREKIFLVLLGSLLGGLLRLLISTEISFYLLIFYEKIECNIILINTLGPFFMGLTAFLEKLSKKTIYYILHRGFLRSFTTFSAVSYELFNYIELNNIYLAFLYLLLTTIFGFTAYWFGFILVPLNKKCV